MIGPRAAALLVVLGAAGYVQAQVVTAPGSAVVVPDLSAYATKSDVQTVADAASAARASADGSVKKVGGTGPDGQGNVALPNAFANANCADCTMTGTLLLNGQPIATAGSISSAIAGINFPVTSVNGLGGAVTVPAYTDSMAIAANAPAISSLTAAASAASRESVQVSNPASGATVTSNTGTTLLFINNPALLAALTVTFPASPVDGQRFTVAANNAVTVLTFSGGTGRGLLAALSANGYARYAYSSAVGAWLRTG